MEQLKEQHEQSNVLRIEAGKEMKYLIETDQKLDEELLGSEDKVYEVIDGSLHMSGNAFAVFNNIPVVEEGRELFEERFQARARKIESEPGFVAIRVCRPLNSDTYMVLTLWDTEDDFETWRQSNAYQHAHEKRKTSEGIDVQKPQIFPRPSYVEKYHITE